MAVRTHAHAASTLFRDDGIGTRSTESAYATCACKGFLQYAQSSTTCAVYLDGTTASAQAATASPGCEDWRALGVNGGRVHDLELRARVSGIVVLMRQVTAEAAVNGWKGL